MVKKRGPGRPRGSKNKVTAQKAVPLDNATKRALNLKDDLIEKLVGKIQDLNVIIAYLEEKLESK